MADPRIVEYIHENLGKYSPESLRDALIEQGYDPKHVEEAFREAAKREQPPSPPARDMVDRRKETKPPKIEQKEAVPEKPASAPAGGYVELRPGRMLGNAFRIVRNPAAFFSALDPKGAVGTAAVNVLIWAVIGGVVFAGIGFATAPNELSRIAALFQAVFFPAVAVLLSFVIAALFHVVCMLLKGKGTLRRSYQLVSALSFLFPASALLSALPFAGILAQVYGFYLTARGAIALHGVDRRKAFGAFGALAAVCVALSAATTLGVRKFQRLAGAGNLPQAVQRGLIKQVDQAMSDPKTAAQIQQAVAQSGPILRELSQYGNMAKPPDRVLRALDDDGKRMLRESWERMSSPTRKAVTETIPAVKREDRTATLKRMLEASREMDQAIKQGMQALDMLMQRPPGEGP